MMRVAPLLYNGCTTNDIPNPGDTVHCVRCGDEFIAGVLCFERACTRCFDLFETQKMNGRFARLGIAPVPAPQYTGKPFPYQTTESFPEWLQAHPFVSTDEDRKLQAGYGMTWADQEKVLHRLASRASKHNRH